MKRIALIAFFSSCIAADDPFHTYYPLRIADDFPQQITVGTNKYRVKGSELFKEVPTLPSTNQTATITFTNLVVHNHMLSTKGSQRDISEWARQATYTLPVETKDIDWHRLVKAICYSGKFCEVQGHQWVVDSSSDIPTIIIGRNASTRSCSICGLRQVQSEPSWTDLK